MNDTVVAAISYIKRGWSIIPLHNIEADQTAGARCSCGSADPTHVRKQGGKHPIAAAWQRSGITDEQRAAEVWRMRPAANIGIITGAVSGFWVLDVDPDNGGHTALAGLVAAYGVLPETYTVTTGSGGMHYYWAIPDWEPHATRGRLPLGLDVRGWGGQVVAPPSVSGKGSYRVGADVPIIAAPEWLLDMIRPEKPRADTLPVRDNTWSASGLGPAAGVVGPATGIAGASPESDTERVRALLAVAVPGELAQLASAPPGIRNQTAFEVACRLIEFVNARWIDGDWAAREYMAAGAAADIDGTFGQDELRLVWRSAWRKVAGKAAVLSDVDYYGSLIPFEAFGGAASDFSSAGTATPGMTPAAPANAAGSSAERPLFDLGIPGFVDPARVGPETPAAAAEPGRVESGAAPVADPQEAARERAISVEMSRLWVRREAERRLGELGQRRRDWAAELLDEDRLAEIEPPVWLIEGWFARNSIVRINGPSGHGKSFVAIEQACCVASGRSWHGLPVASGLAVVVAAEGASGVKQRVDAWKARHGVERLPQLLVLPSPVQVTATEWKGFVAYLAGLRPALVTLDTQARVTVGVDENSATEMGEFVDGLEALRAATGACVSVVHHRGLRGSDGRGSSAVKGAMTTEVDVTRQGTTVTISCRKQKDAAEPESLIASLTPMGESAVLVVAGDSGTAMLVDGVPAFLDPPVTKQDMGRVRLLALVAVMRDQFGEGNGGTRAEIRSAYLSHPDIAGLSTDSKRQAWHRSWGRLEELGRIARNPMAGLRFRFAEVQDQDDLAENPDNHTDFGWPIAKKTNRAN